MLAHDILIERDAEAWFVGDCDEAFVDDGLLDTLHHVLPPGHIQRVILAGQEILGGRGAVHAGEGADRQAGIVHGHRHAVFHSGVADLMGFEDAARRRDVRMNLADSVLLAQIDERLLQVNIFAGQDRSGTFHRDALQQVGVLPGNYILYPGEIVFLVSLAQSNDGMHADVAQVIHGERNFHTHGFARRCHVGTKHLDSFVGYLGGGERMGQLTPLPRGLAGRHSHRSGSLGDHLDAQVHFQPREAHLVLANL